MTESDHLFSMVTTQLGLHGGSPPFLAYRGIRNVFLKLASNPHVAELLRFIFLGTVVELSKFVGLKIVSFAKHCMLHNHIFAFSLTQTLPCTSFYRKGHFSQQRLRL